jgi:phospholipid transport system substrate-binding protein
MNSGRFLLGQNYFVAIIAEISYFEYPKTFFSFFKGSTMNMRYIAWGKSKQYLWILIFLVMCQVMWHRVGEAGQPGPTEVIQTFNATLLDVMKRADELGYAGRYKLLDPVLKDTFAFTFMGTMSVGKFWATMSEAQRKLFLDTYTEWSIATYAGRFDGYSGERFDLVSESSPIQSTITVVVKLIQANEGPITFYYLMRFIEGRWRVVDIQISGVSQLALTRAQFTEVLKNRNYDALIAMLKTKIAGFANAKKQ